MKPFLHAKSSADKFGGVPEDYLDIHDFMDSSKAHLADHRHRAVLHSTFGCFIVEQVFGTTRTNSVGQVYSTRDVAEQHCLEDLGKIPTVQDWLAGVKIEPWMSQPVSTTTTYPASEEAAVSPAQMIQSVLTAQKAVQASVAEIQKKGLGPLGAYFAPIFDDPNIVAICWAQYAPYFNDGDPCEFGVSDMEVVTRLTEYNGQELYAADYGYGGEFDSLMTEEELRRIDGEEVFRSLNGWRNRRNINYPFPPLVEELKSLTDNEDVCRSLFGDDSFVILTKDGFRIEEYRHD